MTLPIVHLGNSLEKYQLWVFESHPNHFSYIIIIIIDHPMTRLHEEKHMMELFKILNSFSKILETMGA